MSLTRRKVTRVDSASAEPASRIRARPSSVRAARRRKLVMAGPPGLRCFASPGGAGRAALPEGISLRSTREREPGPALAAHSQRLQPAGAAADQGARLPEHLEP